MKSINWLVIGLGIGLLFGVAFAFFMHSMFPKTIYYNFDIAEEEVVEEECKYDKIMLPKEYSKYICDLSEQLEIDVDLAVAILLQENPMFNPSAVHQNKNGTFDCGLFQLNSRSIDIAFLPNYWTVPEDFDPFNWKMNTFMALHHIQDLSKSLKVFDDIVCAYNAGYGAVLKGTIPESTQRYLASVKKNYFLLRGI